MENQLEAEQEYIVNKLQKKVCVPSPPVARGMPGCFLSLNPPLTFHAAGGTQSRKNQIKSG